MTDARRFMEQRHHQLLARANATFGQKPVSETIAKTKAIIGVMTLPAGEDSAQSALDKLRGGRVPTPTELAALELVIRLMRPAPLSRNGNLDKLPDYNKYEEGLVLAWEKFRQAIRAHLYAIGRLDRTGNDTDSTGIGTGFLIDDDLVITNRHVLDKLSWGAGELAEGQAVIRFQQEFGTPETEPAIPVLEKVKVHPFVDIAVLRIKRTKSRTPLKLSRMAITSGARVVAIGYPWDDPSRNPLFIRQIYGGDFGVKRAAPGQVTDTSPTHLFHDCSTLGGNSGSPMLSMETAEVIGVHSSGYFMYRNEAVQAAAVRELGF